MITRSRCPGGVYRLACHPFARASSLLLLATLLLLQTGCVKRSASDPEAYRQGLFAFGTLVEVEVPDAPRPLAIQAVNLLDQRFQVMHREWHAWKPGGELMRLNHSLAQGEPFIASDTLRAMLEQTKTLSAASDGLFNPAIGRLIGLWGFHGDEYPEDAPPGAEEINQLVRQAPGMDALRIQGNRISSDNRSVQLDLNAFAKGYALDQAITILAREGIGNAMVNAGDLCVTGTRHGAPWRIGIRHPQGTGIIATVEAAGKECVMTSGNYERYRRYQGRRYAHLIDPRSGWPVEHVASATVIHSDGGLAGAAALALAVAGPQDWQRIATRMGLTFAMLVDEAGNLYLSSGMAKRIQFAGKPAGRVVVVDLPVSPPANSPAER